MPEKLLPCPFCAGRAERVDISEGDNGGGSCISCTVCHASGNVEFGFKENFVSNWNRRDFSPMTVAGAVVTAIAASGWQPIDTAPGMTDVLVWWPRVKLDDDGDPTDVVTGGGAFVSERQGNYWIEPDALNAMGDHMGDDETYAENPSHWMPLPPAPNGATDA